MSSGYFKPSTGGLGSNVNLTGINGVAPAADAAGSRLAVSIYGQYSTAGDKQPKLDTEGKVYTRPPTIGTTQVTTDLPSSAGPPLEIDCSGKSVVKLYVYTDFYWTMAADLATGTTRLGSNTTRSKLPTGTLEITVHDTTNKVYIKSQGSALVEGVTYWFLEK